MLRLGRSLTGVRTTRLQISLRDVIPRVMRVIDVPADSTLPELHNILQVALGWTDTHLHQFVAGEVRYGVPEEENWDGELDESRVSISALPGHSIYLYDFGDGWTHDVEVLGAGGDLPGCVFGEGACPPEDCGGPYGYTELLEVLADPAHPEHAEMREWAGELRNFDQAAISTSYEGYVPGSLAMSSPAFSPTSVLPCWRRPGRCCWTIWQQRCTRWSGTDGRQPDGRLPCLIYEGHSAAYVQHCKG
jgi:hypothetical protein